MADKKNKGPRLSDKTNFFMKNKTLTVFSILAICIVLVAVFAPIVSGGIDPTEGSLADAIKAPSAEHIFGTDKMGRDIYARVIYGSRVSLVSSFSIVLLAFGVGTFLGILAGYFRGAVDMIIMRIADMMLAFPGLVLAMAVAGIMGASIRNAIFAIALVTWPKYARLARSLVLKIRDRDYVAAAVVTGSKVPYILTRYMLPNVLPTIIVTAATDIGGLMLELAGLSFLGFGAVSPTPEWGLMLSEGRAYMQSAPWLMIFPGLAIFVTVVVFNMLGDSIRDILDPRSDE
jgi:ABC-type dipeptide/oligopeptide/nickel transport system permease subunit